MLTDCTFNEETHEYTYRGQIIPGVTESLASAGLINFDHVSAEMLEWKSELGKEVHKLRHLFDVGRLGSYDPALTPYLSAWTEFRRESGFIYELSEHWQGTELYGMPYGMKIDVAGRLNGQETIIDVKTGELYPHHAIQLAGYAAGLAHMDYKSPAARFTTRQRVVVQLRSDGTYRAKYFEDRYDLVIFEACLRIATYKKERKIG